MNLNFKIGAFFFWATLSFLTSASAQEEITASEFQFETFELPNGVWGNHVQSITQDSFGFIWFGSQAGLHRWDGYQFKTYLNNLLDSSSLSGRYIEYLYVAKDGTLWVGTWETGLNRYNHRTDNFTRFIPDPEDPSSLLGHNVQHIIEDQEGYLWISTNLGINRFDPSTGKFKRFVHDPEDPGSISHPVCRVAYIDSQGTLWFGTGFPWQKDDDGGGLNRYDPKTESFTHFKHDPNDPQSLTSNKITAIYEDSKGNFWVGTTGDGLHIMDRKTGKFQRLKEDPNNPKKLSAPKPDQPLYEWHTRFIFEDPNQNLWVGAWTGGLKYYDTQKREVSHYFKSSSTDNLPEDFVWNMFQSRDGTLWGWTAGTKAAVFKVLKKSNIKFNQISIPDAGLITSIYQKKDGQLWVGTCCFGLISIDLSDKNVHFSYKNDPKNPTTFVWSKEENGYLGWDRNRIVDYISKRELFDDINLITEDKEGYLWLARQTFYDSEEVVLLRFHPIRKELKSFSIKDFGISASSSVFFQDILSDKEGNIWVASITGDLYLFKPETESFQRFSNPLLCDNEPADCRSCINVKITQARDGTLWLAGHHCFDINVRPFFVLQFDPKLQKFKSFDIKEFERNALSEYVLGIQEDPQGNIWINTTQSLIKFNPSIKTQIIKADEMLSSRFLNRLNIDKTGKIWLLGDYLISIDTKTETSNVYFKIINGVLRFANIYQSQEELLFIGDDQHLQYFSLNQIKSSLPQNATEVLISDFQLLDQPDGGDNPLFSGNTWKTPKVRLPYHQNMFEFHFSALDFYQPENNRHEYRLLGLYDQWRQAGKNPIANYYNLSPGDYTFQVRAANANGKWGTPKSVEITIVPPWWRTWWAYGAYLFFISLLVYLVYQYQLNRKLAVAEAQRLKELDTVKTQLYTNITHEFRTPLTVILGMARQALDQPKEYFRQGLQMVIRNGENLLSLVNQMLDLSKLESGKMNLNLHQGDIVNYLKYLIESFHSFAETKNIQIHFLTNLEALSMDYDEEKVQQVVSNLISNAVKFTPPGGNIYFTAGQSVENEKPHFFIKVKDTGKGIPEGQLPHIFDRFYQVDNTDTKESGGSGIGLALTKELIHLMEGKITVSSIEGNGSEFEVLLPIHLNSPIQVSDIERKRELQKIELPIIATTTKGISTAMLANKASKSTPTILIAEDNPDVVQYLTSCLASEYQLKIAVDGQEGIDIAIETTPDLIISDVMMPQKDGFEVCQTLKQDERTSHIPIIMLTAKADIESKLEGLEQGADAYLAKPFHKEELLIRIKKQLELRKNLQSHYLNLAGSNGKTSIIQEAPNIKKPEDHFVQKVRKVVEDNMDNFDFSIEMLCQEIHMSNSQLHRKLSALTGFSATHFVRYIRLSRAKELLANPELTITAVAFDTGFQDPSYFGRVFKKEFGVTPLEWRELEMERKPN